MLNESNVYAPIALFVYNRPKHTKHTIEALLKNSYADRSELFIYSDAPKDDKSVKEVQQVREYIKNISGFKSITVYERKDNLGLANSITDGVTRLCCDHGRVIVLEDDLITSKHFLSYMNNALNLYENEKKVVSIHAYGFPITGQVPETFFLKVTGCWGWATWKRGWDLYEPDGKKLLDLLEKHNMLDKFNLFGDFNYKSMLVDQIRGVNDSWAIRWYAATLLQDKLTLHPGKSLISNAGFDGIGSHCGTNNRYSTVLSNEPVHVGDIEIVENTYMLNAWRKYFRYSRLNIFSRILNKIKNIKLV